MAVTLITAAVATWAPVLAGGAASTMFGLSAFGSFMARAAIGLALNALAPKPTSAAAATGYQVTQSGTAIDHQIVYGRMKVAGVRIFDATTGNDNKYLHRVIAFTGHEIEDFDEIWINDAKVTSIDANGYVTQVLDADGSTSDRYSTKVRIKQHLGAADQTADADLVSEVTDWTTDHRLRGVSYLYVRMEFDQDTFPNGVPEITAVIKGKKVYDPRTDTTAWSDNPALCIRDYLTNAYGLGEVAANIDDSLVSAAANICDETNTVAGTTRFTCNGAFTTAQSPYDILGVLTTSMGGLLWYAQGQWRIKPAYWVAPTLTLDENDLRSSIQVTTRHSRRDNFNIVRGTFRGQESDWQVTDYPEVTDAAYVTADGGQESVADVALPFTDNSIEARRIARIALERNRQQITVIASFGLKAFQCQVGDVINLNSERFGWTNKSFEVIGWTFGLTDDLDLQVQMTLREISESVFDEVSDGIVYERDNTSLATPFITVAPQNFVVSDGGFTTDDGTYVNSFIVDWDAPEDAFVDFYVLEWRIQGESKFKSVNLKTTEYQIAPVLESQTYEVRVKAVNTLGVSGPYATTTASVGGDTVAPSVPTSLSATGGLGFIEVKWTNPADKDLNIIKVFESDNNLVGAATEVGRTSGDNFIRGNLSPLTTKYYWVSAVDFSGNESAKAGPVSATSSQITAGDIGPAVIAYENLDTSLSGLLDGFDTDIQAAQATLLTKVDIADYNITVDYQQQLEDATTQLATDALSLALNASSLESRINDAGITVDPATGSVTIQGLSAIEDRVNIVEVDLDAVEGELTLKASTTYVDSAIAAAQLPEATVTELENTVARVDQVEIDLNSIEGAITLTSTGSLYDVNDGVLGVEALEGRITVAEGNIALKASQTELDDVDTRLTSAEITLGSLDVAEITFSVSEVRAISEKQDDLADLTLKEVLGRYNDRKFVREDVAFARQSLTADVNDQREALAQATLELGVRIDENQASIVSEQTARATADSALASDITTLQADVGTNAAAIQTEATARADADSALSTLITALQADVDDNAAAIQTEQTARATADTALASDITNLTATVTSNTADIVANTAAIATEATARATADSALSTSITNLSATVSSNTSAIATEATARANADSALAADISSLSSTVSSNTAAINSEAVTRASADSALASDITTLTTTVGSNTTSISTLSQSIDGVEAKYGVTIDNNGNATGFQLLSGVGGSAFNVRADQFAVFDSDNNGGVPPFTVFTTSRTIGGVVYPAGTYIENAYIDNASIVDGSITNAKIGELSADKITAGTLNVDRINSDDITKTVSTFNPNTIGLGVGSFTQIASVVIDTVGRPVDLLATVDVDRYWGVLYELRRDSVVLRQSYGGPNVWTGINASGTGLISTSLARTNSLAYVDTPSAGTYTYSLWATRNLSEVSDFTRTGFAPGVFNIYLKATEYRR